MMDHFSFLSPGVASKPSAADVKQTQVQLHLFDPFMPMAQQEGGHCKHQMMVPSPFLSPSTVS